MMRYLVIFLILISGFDSSAQNKVRIEVSSLPAYHSSNSSIYIAGSFNNWNPEDPKYKLQQENSSYYINLSLASGSYEFKFTRGGWDKVESTIDGNAIANRTLTVQTDLILSVNIEGWQDRFPPKPKASTASKNVRIIEKEFFLPQLNRKRRIWIYLPEDYYSSKKKYPIIYMHDGQNIFEDTTSFSGEWGVDEFLDTTNLKKSIVVAIDHGDEKRMSEYNPYDNTRFGKAEGDEYLEFLVNTLRPYINKQYRTKRCRKSTFIAGSSMGGLISTYAVLKYPKVFGGAGVFSPAFWLTDQKLFNEITARGKKLKKSRFYFFAGKLEGDQMVPDMLKAVELLAGYKKVKIESVIRDQGRHNEATWKEEFPLFYRWIF